MKWKIEGKKSRKIKNKFKTNKLFFTSILKCD